MLILIALAYILTALTHTLIALAHTLIALPHTLIALAHTLIALDHTLIVLTYLNSTEKMHRLYLTPPPILISHYPTIILPRQQTLNEICKIQFCSLWRIIQEEAANMEIDGIENVGIRQKKLGGI